MQRTGLIAARARQHWTLLQASIKIGVDSKTLNSWENGRSFPHPYNMQQLCMVYQATPQELGLTRANTRLFQARQQRHLSIDEVAEQIGVNRGTISRWEHGLSYPQPLYLRRLCDFYQMTAEELFQDEACTSRSDVGIIKSAIQRIDDTVIELVSYRDQLKQLLAKN